MNKIPNIEGVKEIHMRPFAFTKCRIGQDLFLNKLEAVFYPREFYPDYMEVEAFVQKNIEGKEMNIEEAASCLLQFLKLYDPARVIVFNRVEMCKTHFPVEVIVE
jgi:hypothetical protein